MSPWALRGLREGVVTTRWPASQDPYEADWRGPVVVTPVAEQAVQPGSLTGICPTDAITADSGQLLLDQGSCILCGRCVRERPELFAWSRGAQTATLARQALVVPQLPETSSALAAARAELRVRTAALRRSVHLRHVDAGSDGTEEQEIAALLNPVYDIHRLGIFFTASPRHADILLVTGAGAPGMAEPLRRTYEGMPAPKVVIAVGTDAISGGLLRGADGADPPAGVGAILPVDVWVPGSPPPPFSILHALLIATGRLADAEGNRA